MTHVSQKKMEIQASRRIKKNLVNVLKVREGLILESLLTPTETTMLAKRLALIVMLERECTSYEICKMLNVSISTVLRFEQMLKAGVFRHIQQELAKKKPLSFLEFIEVMLSRGPYGASQAKRKRIAQLKSRLWA